MYPRTSASDRYESLTPPPLLISLTDISTPPTDKDLSTCVVPTLEHMPPLYYLFMYWMNFIGSSCNHSWSHSQLRNFQINLSKVCEKCGGMTRKDGGFSIFRFINKLQTFKSTGDYQAKKSLCSCGQVEDNYHYFFSRKSYIRESSFLIKLL